MQIVRQTGKNMRFLATLEMTNKKNSQDIEYFEIGKNK